MRIIIIMKFLWRRQGDSKGIFCDSIVCGGRNDESIIIQV